MNPHINIRRYPASQAPLQQLFPVQPGVVRADTLERMVLQVPQRQAVPPELVGVLGTPADPPTAAEVQLVEMIISVLNDPKHNPYQGSVPVERVQNVCRARFGHLYDTVVGVKHNSWRRFLERHPDQFEVFTVDDGKLRMRWLPHTNWKAGDELEQADRALREAHFVRCIFSHLRRQDALASTVDAFIEAYPTLEENALRERCGESHIPLPARGDLVRFVKRHSTFFDYDSKSLRILLREPLPPSITA